MASISQNTVARLLRNQNASLNVLGKYVVLLMVK